MSPDHAARPVAVKRPVTLITGASSGLGEALAREFAAHGHELLLVARRGALLEALADAIAAGGGPRPHVVTCDLAQADAGERIQATMDELGIEPQFIVNNAGFGLAGPAAAIGIAAQAELIDVNVRALTDLSLRWIDALERHRGGILNLASIAGFLPGPHMAAYHASKAYVLSLSVALRHELAPRGVRVCALCPGPVLAGFQARAGIDIAAFPQILTRSAERVAREGYLSLMRGDAVLVPGFANQVLTFLPRLLPRGLLAWAMGRGSADRTDGTPKVR